MTWPNDVEMGWFDGARDMVVFTVFAKHVANFMLLGRKDDNPQVRSWTSVLPKMDSAFLLWMSRLAFRCHTSSHRGKTS